jgi:predicted DNA-binding transcriptional regulator YafY
LIRAGRRWHARAFCSTNRDFRDYALGRIENAKLLDPPSEQLDHDDKAWMTKVAVRLVAHPDLTPDYQLAVANIEEVRPWLFPG